MLRSGFDNASPGLRLGFTPNSTDPTPCLQASCLSKSLASTRCFTITGRVVPHAEVLPLGCPFAMLLQGLASASPLLHLRFAPASTDSAASLLRLPPTCKRLSGIASPLLCSRSRPDMTPPRSLLGRRPSRRGGVMQRKCFTDASPQLRPDFDSRCHPTSPFLPCHALPSGAACIAARQIGSASLRLRLGPTAPGSRRHCAKRSAGLEKLLQRTLEP